LNAGGGNATRDGAASVAPSLPASWIGALALGGGAGRGDECTGGAGARRAGAGCGDAGAHPTHSAPSAASAIELCTAQLFPGSKSRHTELMQ
jgi:hypothetical protein